MKNDTVEIVTEMRKLLEEQDAALKHPFTEDTALLYSMRAVRIKHLVELLHREG